MKENADMILKINICRFVINTLQLFRINNCISYLINLMEGQSVILELMASGTFGKQNPYIVCGGFLDNSACTNFFLKDMREGSK